MATPAETTTGWLRDWQKQLADQVNALGLRISSWLLLGNAAALVLILKAVLEGSPCAQQLLFESAWFFVAGLSFAFIGAAGTYLTNLAGLTLLGKVLGLVNQLAVNEYYIAQLESEGIELPEDAPLRTQIVESQHTMDQLNGNVPRLWVAFWAIVGFFLLSAASFGAGVVAPLQGELAATCIVSDGSRSAS